ncbi:MAG: OsmC family protein [Chitinophagales bacterium]|nr:OsmC family protein [Chitinophagales bacterium]
MKTDELKALQSPLKEQYKIDPESAIVILKAEGKIGEGISCKVETGKKIVEAGLHPATGGNGLLVCSGDMLLEALVACAGVTVSAVATAIGIQISEGVVSAEGELDFRGTLGVSKEAPVGFKSINLTFNIVSDASAEQISTLSKLTERYCVVYQTLIKGVPVITTFHTNK